MPMPKWIDMGKSFIQGGKPSMGTVMICCHPLSVKIKNGADQESTPPYMFKWSSLSVNKLANGIHKFDKPIHDFFLLFLFELFALLLIYTKEKTKVLQKISEDFPTGSPALDHLPVISCSLPQNSHFADLPIMPWTRLPHLLQFDVPGIWGIMALRTVPMVPPIFSATLIGLWIGK